jgi:hypothetical protein
MALIKILSIGDELVFDLREMSRDSRRISIFLVERAGRAAVLKISADRSIPIKQFKQAHVPDRSDHDNDLKFKQS